MKRVLAILMILVLMLPLAACGNEETTTGSTAPVAEFTGTTAPTESTTQPTEPEPTEPEPTEPAEPEPVSEVRTDGLMYIPDFYSTQEGVTGLYLWIHLAENCYPGMDVTFELSINAGKLQWSSGVAYNYLRDTHAKVQNKSYTKWQFQEKDQSLLEQDGAVFVRAVIRADKQIVGYGIFEIGTNKTDSFAPMRTETVIFPMIDGALQEVSEEYVQTKLDELCQTVTPFDLEAKLAEFTAYSQAVNPALDKLELQGPAGTILFDEGVENIFQGEVELSELPGIVFKWDRSSSYGFVMIKDGVETQLFTEVMSLRGVYAGDVTGDGYPDLCANSFYPYSGYANYNEIIVYDVMNDQYFTLSPEHTNHTYQLSYYVKLYDGMLVCHLYSEYARMNIQTGLLSVYNNRVLTMKTVWKYGSPAVYNHTSLSYVSLMPDGQGTVYFWLSNYTGKRAECTYEQCGEYIILFDNDGDSIYAFKLTEVGMEFLALNSRKVPSKAVMKHGDILKGGPLF